MEFMMREYDRLVNSQDRTGSSSSSITIAPNDSPFRFVFESTIFVDDLTLGSTGTVKEVQEQINNLVVAAEHIDLIVRNDKCNHQEIGPGPNDSYKSDI
eukprot:m.119795 g.119795  ORF g.119795 m.119795 type:complete len:99 (+) comp13316_c0_seq2:340-636(+)